MAARYSPYPHTVFYNPFIPKLEDTYSPPVIPFTPPTTAGLYGPHIPGLVTYETNKLSGRSLPRFLENLWTMLNDESIKCINWSGVNCFIVSSKEALSRNVLPKFFKHNRLSSFTRQLHMYQFEKLKDKSKLEWKHTYLNRGNYNLLYKIHRKQINEDKKQNLVMKEMVLKIQEQKQIIAQLQCRMGVLENEVKRGQEMHASIQNQLLNIREVLRNLTRLSPNRAQHF